MNKDKKERNTFVRDLKPIKCSNKEDPIMILIIKINSLNVSNYNQFICFI